MQLATMWVDVSTGSINWQLVALASVSAYLLLRRNWSLAATLTVALAGSLAIRPFAF